MSHSPDEVARQFFTLLPKVLSLDTLSEYGIEVSPEQAQQIVREMLSLNLYWIHAALSAHLSAKDADQVFTKLQQRIEKAWESEFQLQGHEAMAYWMEMKERRKAYEQIVRDGGTPPSVYMEAVALLESSQATQPEDQRKLLALFIDLIPEDMIGQLAAELEAAK